MKQRTNVWLVYNVGLLDDEKILVFSTKTKAIEYIKKRGGKKDSMFGWLIPSGYNNIPYKLERKVVRGLAVKTIKEKGK